MTDLTQPLPPAGTPEGDAARIFSIDRMIEQTLQGLENLKACRRAQIATYLGAHGVTLPDGRRIEPIREGAFRIVDRRPRRG